MGKYVRILCGVMAVLVAATALGLWQLAEAPQYVAAAESRGQAKPVSFGTDTALVPVHLESQTQEEQLVLRVLAADTEEPVRGALFVVELIDGDGQKTVCKDWDLDGVITTEAMPEGDYTAHLRTLAGFLMPEDTVVTVEPMKREVIDVSDQVVSSDLTGFSETCIFDETAGIMLDDDFVKLIAWYDNEWGYTSKLLDLMAHMYEVDHQ